jgi:hypothetical protein
MGHERVGALPRTREWRSLVQQIAATAETPETVPAVAAATLLKVRQRFDRISSDAGFQAAFGFILGLVTPPPAAQAAEDVAPVLNLANNPSPLRLTAQMHSWVDAHADSLEYAELGKRAVADVIAFWTRERSRQTDLFGRDESSNHIWGAARNAGAFSDVCRVFFGKFTERYIKYFLDREASAQLPSIEARERFAVSLERHIDALARHSFETTKITQSFAAGWYNKHARQSRPDRQTVAAFLTFAMGKLREELLRESSAQ